MTSGPSCERGRGEEVDADEHAFAGLPEKKGELHELASRIIGDRYPQEDTYKSDGGPKGRRAYVAVVAEDTRGAVTRERSL